MVELTWNHAIEVTDAHTAMDAVNAQAPNHSISLKTPEGGLFTLGSRYWLAVGTKLIREFPNHRITIIVDAGEDAGIAMGAIADGHKAVRFTGDAQTFEKLAQMATSNQTILLK